MLIKIYYSIIVVTLWKLDCLQCDVEDALRYNEAFATVDSMISALFSMFEVCKAASMPNQQFLTDNLQNFINYPSKTTVGYAPKFTGNRKFFANLLSSRAFKEMLANDMEELKRDLVKKLKYCDEIVMDQDIMKEFYDREVDQSKLKR